MQDIKLLVRKGKLYCRQYGVVITQLMYTLQWSNGKVRVMMFSVVRSWNLIIFGLAIVAQ